MKKWTATLISGIIILVIGKVWQDYGMLIGISLIVTILLVIGWYCRPVSSDELLRANWQRIGDEVRGLGNSLAFL